MSIENEIYLRFVTSVIAPLKSLVEADSARKQDVLETIGKISGLASDLESFLRVETKGVIKPSTPPAPTVSAPESQAGTTPLDRWLSSAKKLAPRQRSIAREIEILKTLEEANGAIALKRLHDHLISLGLSETGGQPAVVTQISRLKNKDGMIKSEAQGLYARTDAGTDRLQKLRRNYASLFAPEEVRTLADNL